VAQGIKKPTSSASIMPMPPAWTVLFAVTFRPTGVAAAGAVMETVAQMTRHEPDRSRKSDFMLMKS
jgi:hypothetical protein